MEKEFYNKTLELGRDSRGFTQSELSLISGVPQSDISRYESGTLRMNDNDLEKIATALNYPKSFFYRKIDIFPPNLHYRKKATVTAKVLARVEAIMNIYKANIEELLKSVEFSNNYLPTSSDVANLTAQEAARFLRQYWKIPRGPIPNLTKLVESKGIVVIHFDFQTNKIDGRSILTDKGVPIIFLNSSFSTDRQRFTLAHELGHIIMHVYSAVSFLVDVEAEAFQFAAEFLAPQNEIFPFLNNLTIAKLVDLKRYWKISMQAMVYWAQRMEAITANQARYLWSQFNSLRIKEKEPIEFETELPSFIFEIVNFYLNKKSFTIDSLSEKLCLNKSEFENGYLPSQNNMRLIK